MTLLRTLKSKGWASLIALVLISVYLVSSWDTTFHTEKLKQQSQYQQQAFKPKSAFKPGLGHKFERLTPARRQLLSSALAHIRLGYVANRTPPYSTPPLLVLYTCRPDTTACGSLGDRLINIVNAYYFSMLQQGSAFAYDMVVPAKMEWFFEASPSYMSMNVDQANYYLERAEAHQVRSEAPLSSAELVQRRFMEDYEAERTTIVKASQWQGGWMDLKENPWVKPLRDKYRLNHLLQKSDWFWLASRLLFSKPASNLRGYLEPYRELMGGKLEISESLSPFDPDNSPVTPEFATKGWLRIGLRIGKHSTQEEAMCLCAHVANVCRKHTENCHVFISAPNRQSLATLRTELNKHQHIAVHAVADGYGFADLDQESENSLDHSIFDSDDDRLVRDYARTFMDWLILSRMDRLVGQEKDVFLKTAAWAAQVHTDVSVHNTTSRNCRIIPMYDW
ncbi:hypothetical protein V8B55DRAFT_1459429 [Mucor lusitanicus]|uniref:Uncharacterized protein n=2 Tax=Mucor circinelloides f. lusitanicus TaxID=29924 RepID=A0A168KH97_MUCCL|nr:hypothetical protein FB192DRAFT_1352230 [Mucor lusitanicus]OAD02387.1 hypothetical protein MUCCIDRAFT_190106 [Mucor lusitanicus CBS 277.49]